MALNWPELEKFCGCCSLKVGIYIFGVYQLVSSFVMTWTDIEQIAAVIKYMKRPHDSNPCLNVTGFFDESSSLLQIKHRGYDDADFIIAARFLVIHLMGWVIGKTAVLITMILMLYGTYKNQPKYLKFYLNFSIPCWVFSTYICALNVFFLSHARKIIAISYTLITAYQILAARSAYRIMTGKSQFYKETDLYLVSYVEPEMMTIDHQSPTLRQRQTDTAMDSRHCDTCQCGYTHLRQNNSIQNTVPSSPKTNSDEANQEAQNNEAEPKELNFKEEPIVFDLNQLVQRRNPLLEEPHSSSIGPRHTHNDVRESSITIRSNTLAVGANTGNTEQEKYNFDDMAVIYDPAQLNVGQSPILEDR